MEPATCGAKSFTSCEGAEESGCACRLMRQAKQRRWWMKAWWSIWVCLQKHVRPHAAALMPEAELCFITLLLLCTCLPLCESCLADWCLCSTHREGYAKHMLIVIASSPCRC